MLCAGQCNSGVRGAFLASRVECHGVPFAREKLGCHEPETFARSRDQHSGHGTSFDEPSAVSSHLYRATYYDAMTNWVTISAFTTGGGTLVLAGATFASVRSANRSSRAAERSLLAGIRPLLMTSRSSDPTLKVGFADNHYVHLPGGTATAEVTEEAIYLTMSVRNVGNGIAIMHGWRIELSRDISGMTRPEVSDFHRLTRDLYVAVGDVSFWQGAFRDPTETDFSEVSARIKEPERMFLDILYGDHQGGQRVISRFSLVPRPDGAWFPTVVRHWNVDQPDPR
jgi:hypothetical protein